MRVYVKNGRHLVIKDATEKDSDAYKMVLSSIAGRVSVNFQIMVSCECFTSLSQNIFASTFRYFKQTMFCPYGRMKVGNVERKLVEWIWEAASEAMGLWAYGCSEIKICF